MPEDIKEPSEREFSYELKKFEVEAYARIRLVLQANQAATDYGLKGLRSLFLLNGAAATAILATKTQPLYGSAVCFAIGAGLTVLALGLSYILNFINITAFQALGIQNEEKAIPVNMGWKKTALSIDDTEKFRVVIIGVSGVALLCFFVGVGCVWPSV